MAFRKVVAAVIGAHFVDGLILAVGHQHLIRSEVAIEIIWVALQTIFALQIEVYDVIIEQSLRGGCLLHKLNEHLDLTAWNRFIGSGWHEAGENDVLGVGDVNSIISGVGEGLAAGNPPNDAQYYGNI